MVSKKNIEFLSQPLNEAALAILQRHKTFKGESNISDDEIFLRCVGRMANEVDSFFFFFVLSASSDVVFVFLGC